VTVNVAGVSRAANDTGAATSQVLNAASDLARQAEQITAGVEGFIRGVNAA